MLQPKQLLIFILTFLFYSCNNSSKYSNAIKDFRPKLQPILVKIVEKGIVMYDDSDFRKVATDIELENLGKCEHPILRAAAFREMLNRKSFNKYRIIMRHLNDTALVFVDEGEFGLADQTISDYILDKATWKTQDDKDKTIEEVLTRRNYLRSAYTILDSLKPQEKYYKFIKDMATRPRTLDPSEGYELGFSDIEYALYGLAKFRKKEDVAIIKQKLMKEVYQISDRSFRLMTNYPDSAYLDVLQTYLHRQFYHFSGVRPHGFTGFKSDRAAPEDFINALVVQQNDRSANLLDNILTDLPKHTCMPARENITDEVILAIWAHPCPAYAKLREAYKEKAIELSRSYITLDMPIRIDTTPRIIRWYP